MRVFPGPFKDKGKCRRLLQFRLAEQSNEVRLCPQRILYPHILYLQLHLRELFTQIKTEVNAVQTYVQQLLSQTVVQSHHAQVESLQLQLCTHNALLLGKDLPPFYEEMDHFTLVRERNAVTYPATHFPLARYLDCLVAGRVLQVGNNEIKCQRFLPLLWSQFNIGTKTVVLRRQLQPKTFL
jgi:hypothetical protein